MADGRIVTVHLLERDSEGIVFGVGNSHECSVGEAIGLIRKDEAKAEGHARGVVPEAWLSGNVAVAAEADEEHGTT